MGFLDSFRKVLGGREKDERGLLSKKVQSSPNDPQARHKLGLFLLRQGEVVEGLDQLARCAILYEKDGFATKAIAVLRQMIKQDPSNLDFLKWIIRLLAQEGLTGDANREMDALAARQDLFPNDEKKIDYFRVLADAVPKSPMPLLLIADLFGLRRSYLEAITELERAADRPLANEMVEEFGWRLKGMATAAVDNGPVLELCGFLMIRLGLASQGRDVLGTAAALLRKSENGENAAVAEDVLREIDRGWDPAGTRSFEDAARKLTAPPQAPAAPPPPAAPPAHAAEAKGEKEEGGEEEAEGEEGIVKAALGRLQEKVKEEIGDTDLEARYNLGIAYKEMGLLDEAIEEFRISRRKPDLFIGASSLLSDALADKGDVDAGILVLNEVLASDSLSEEERRDVIYHKALLLDSCGREEEAMTIFQMISEVAPDYRDIRQRIEGRKD